MEITLMVERTVYWWGCILSGIVLLVLWWPCKDHENCLKSLIFGLQMQSIFKHFQKISSGRVARGGRQRHAASGHLLLPYYLTFPSNFPILLQKQRKRKYGRNPLSKTTTSPNNCMAAKYNHFSMIKRCNYQSLKCKFFNWPTINLTLLWVIAKIYLIHLKVACL